MTLKISCKYIGDKIYDIIVESEKQTISRENNTAVFKLSQAKNYNIKIRQQFCKSNHTFKNILFFFFTLLFQGFFNILFMNTDSKWYKNLKPYVVNANFDFRVNDDSKLEFICSEGSFDCDKQIKKLPKIECKGISVQTEYIIDKMYLKNKYFEFVKKFISCASVAEGILLILISAGIFSNNFIFTITCSILFTLLLLLQLIVLIVEFKRLKRIEVLL